MTALMDISEEEILQHLQYMSDENMSVWWQPDSQTVVFF